jgi:1-acyl-sn-glycerol-3-phosphate acyltransferase
VTVHLVSIVAVMAVVTLVLAPSVIAAATVGADRAAYRLMSAWCASLLFLSRVHVEADGLEHLPADGSYVVISNHSSHFDGPTLILSLPHPLYFVIKRELARIPLWGWAVVRLGFIAVDRDRSERARAQMQAAVDAIRAGRRVLIFPEGTRAPDDGMLPFKKGGFHLAVDAGVPIVPVAVNRSRQVLPKGQASPTAGTIEVVVGQPIPTAGLGHEDVDRLTAATRAAIIAMRRRDPAFSP